MTSAANPGTHPALSVVMPAYNEAENITPAVKEVLEHVLSVVPSSEFIVVNDGSKDNTGELLDELARTDSRIKVVHQTNGGHGRSLISGMQSATGDYLFLIDSDRQVPLDCFTTLWQSIGDDDGVFGLRTNRQDPLVRRILSRFIGAMLLLIFGVRARDVNAPCKLFRRRIWTDFRTRISSDEILAPSLMLNIFARRHGYRIKEMPVPHRARIQGESTLRPWRLFVFCSRGLSQILKYRSQLI